MKHVLIFFVNIYRKFFSAAKGGPCCRFYPTCSAYAIEALRIHGAFKGSALSLWRLLRCHPFSKGGYDPVPEKRQRIKKENNPLK